MNWSNFCRKLGSLVAPVFTALALSHSAMAADTTPPQLLSFGPAPNQSADAEEVRFELVFDEPMGTAPGHDHTEFEAETVAGTGTHFVRSGPIFETSKILSVRVNMGGGTGTVRLNIDPNTEFTDEAGNVLTLGPLSSTGHNYAFAPSVDVSSANITVDHDAACVSGNSTRLMVSGMSLIGGVADIAPTNYSNAIDQMGAVIIDQNDVVIGTLPLSADLGEEITTGQIMVRNLTVPGNARLVVDPELYFVGPDSTFTGSTAHAHSFDLVALDADCAAPAAAQVQVASTGYYVGNFDPASSSPIFEFVFDKPVNNATLDDFEVTATGTVTHDAPTAFFLLSDDRLATFRVMNIEGEGTLRVALRAGTDIVGQDGGAAPDGTVFEHTVDRVGPQLLSIMPRAGQSPDAPVVYFEATFDEPVSSGPIVFDRAATTVSGTGTHDVASSVTGYGSSVLTFAVNMGGGTGEVRLDFEPGARVEDQYDNDRVLPGGYTAGGTHSYDFSPIFDVSGATVSLANDNACTEADPSSFQFSGVSLTGGDADFPAGSQPGRDYYYTALLDANNVVIGRHAEYIPIGTTNTVTYVWGHAPNVAGDVRAVLDHLGTIPELGTTYTGAGVEMARFDMAALDPDCAPAVPPQVTSMGYNSSPVAVTDQSYSVVTEFSLDVQNVDASDFVLTGTGTATGALSGFTALSPSRYLITVDNIDGAGTLTLGIDPGNDIASVADGAALSGTASFDHVADREGPKLLSIDLVGTPAPNASTVQFLLTFDDDVSSVQAIGIAAVTESGTGLHQALLPMAGANPHERIVSVSMGGGSGVLSLNVPSTTTFTDALGNAEPAAAVTSAQHSYSFSQTIDLSGASVSLGFDGNCDSASSNTRFVVNGMMLTGGEADAPAGFSSPARDFMFAGLIDNAGTLLDSAFISLDVGESTTNRSVFVLADPAGAPFTFFVEDDAPFQNPGTAYSGTPTASLEFDPSQLDASCPSPDSAAPAVQSIAVQGSPSGISETVTWRVIFDEPALNVSTDDFTLAQGGTASGTLASVTLVSGTVFDVVVSAISGEGTLRLDLNAGTDIADASGNAGPSGSSGATHNVDHIRPVASLSASAPATVTAPFTVDVSFDEDVTGFGAGQVQLTNGQISGFIALTARSFRFVVTPEEAGTISVQLNAGAAQDGSGNPSPSTAPLQRSAAGRTVSLSGASSVTEGGDLSLTASLSYAAFVDTVVTFATAGTAVGSDFTLPVSVTIPAGATEAIVTLGTTDDALDEMDETVEISIANITGAGGTSEDGDQSRIATIFDDDDAPEVSWRADGSATETDGTVTLTAELSAASGQEVRVAYATQDGTAIAGSDYTSASGTLVFAPGTVEQTAVVSLSTDGLSEGTESFSVQLSTPVNATLNAAAEATITLFDADTSGLSIADAAAQEGDGAIVFALSLSAPLQQAFTATLSTADGSATAPADYTAQAALTVTFPAGTQNATVSVPILADTLDEPDETLVLSIDSITPPALPVTITDASATGQIMDDDDAPSVAWQADVSGAEGDTLTFTAELSAASGQEVSVEYATTDGSATAPADYTARAGTLSFAPGVLTQTVVVPLNADAVIEPSESFALVLSNPSRASLGSQSAATGTVTDPATATLSIGDAQTAEGTGGTTLLTFPLTLSGTLSEQLDVQVSSADGSALAGEDYTGLLAQTVSIDAEQTAGTVTVSIAADTLHEDDESFSLTLSNPQTTSGLTIALGRATATGTITNDDDAPQLILENLSVEEGDGLAAVIARLNTPSGLDVSFDWATADGTALAASDYSASNGSVTIPALSTQVALNVPLTDDIQEELAESFTLSASAVNGAAAPTNAATITIAASDQSAPSVLLASPAPAMVNGPFDVTVTFSEPVTSFAQGSLLVGNGNVTSFSSVSATLYQARIAPLAEGPVTIDVPVGVVTDGIGLPSLAAAQLSRIADLSRPGWTITGPSAPNTFHMTFTEDVTGMTQSSLAVTGPAFISAFRSLSARVYEFALTPSGPEPVRVGLETGHVFDPAGNEAQSLASVDLGSLQSTDTDAPVVMISGPSEPQAEAFTVSISFSEDVTALDPASLSLAGGTIGALQFNGSSYTLGITPLGGQAVALIVTSGAVQDLAGNPNAEARYDLAAYTAQNAFNDARDSINQTLQSEAKRRLDNRMSANRDMMRHAMQRFISAQIDDNCIGDDCSGFVSRNDIPLDFGGMFEIKGLNAQLQASSFAQDGTMDGRFRRLSFGDIRLARDESGSVTGSLTARTAWEQMRGPDRMTGYFIGGSLDRSKLRGTFDGDATSIGVNAGAYSLWRLADRSYADAYVAGDVTWSQIDMTNGALALDGNHVTASAMFGLGITGVFDGPGYRLLPGVRLDYGYSDLGTVGFDATAFGGTSYVTTSPDAVSQLSVRFAPELQISLGAHAQNMLSIAPSLNCAYQKGTGRSGTRCGSGIALGLEGVSRNGRTRFSFEAAYQETGASRKEVLKFSIESKF